MTTIRRRMIEAMARAGVPVDTALAVLVDVFGAPRAIPPGRFPVLRRSTYTVQAESFREVLEELKPLHEAHWIETEKYRAGLTLNPDYEGLAERDIHGTLLQITARDHAGALIGHVRMFIHHSMHTQTDYGEEDTLYVVPAWRRAPLAPPAPVAIALMRYAENCLLELGIREIRANSKLSNNADALMRRLGYPQVGVLFCKIFADGVQEAAPPREDAAHEHPT